LNIIDNAALNNRKFYSGRVNINTVGVIVLTAVLEGNRELAESIIDYRDGMAGGFTSLSDLQDIEGITHDVFKTLVDHVSVRSSVYEIDCVAHSNATNLEFHVKAIVNREQSEGRILFWREGNSH
jgi:type II secretory pathway component PulK